MHAPPHYADPDPWTERAACRDTDPETFFPLPGASGGVDREAMAKRLCGRCPVARECLREALVHDEGAGIWGGFNARERRELLRIAGTLESTAAELAAYLAGGGRRLSATPRERPAYVWYLRRHGWTPRRIAGALGISFGQVQQAWQLAELASSCTRGPVSGMPNPRAPRKRVRRSGADTGEVTGVERPAIRGGVASLGGLPLPRYGSRARPPGPQQPQLPSGGGHPAGPVPADRRGVPLAGGGRRAPGVGGGWGVSPAAADGPGGRRTPVPPGSRAPGAGAGPGVATADDGAQSSPRSAGGAGSSVEPARRSAGVGSSAESAAAERRDSRSMIADRTRMPLMPKARRLPTGPRVTLTSRSARTFVAPGSPRITITIRPVPGAPAGERGAS
ncbi:WhiB family transcriptional regulator [Streptomyces sp. NPDC002779]|uniref:WhiB family transcriptional regulator n=1 Tax=Streptomyces sp. NPDC002779 TaxID=3364664 RepID=UPI00369F42D9